MKQVNVRLQEDLIKQLKQFALDNDLTFQDVVTIALNDLLFKDKQSKLLDS